MVNDPQIEHSGVVSGNLIDVRAAGRDEPSITGPFYGLCRPSGSEEHGFACYGEKTGLQQPIVLFRG
jgi:hypothetical protein